MVWVALVVLALVHFLEIWEYPQIMELRAQLPDDGLVVVVVAVDIHHQRPEVVLVALVEEEMPDHQQQHLPKLEHNIPVVAVVVRQFPVPHLVLLVDRELLLLDT